jgi:hypothetical protein
LAGWLAAERRGREARLFLAPVLLLGAWLFGVRRAGGAMPLRVDANPLAAGAAVLRALYLLLAANLAWVGTAAVIFGVVHRRIFHRRPWRVAGCVAAAQVAAVSLAGGRALDRTLLPAFPIVFAAMAAAAALFRPRWRQAGLVLLFAGLAAGNLLNPPYPCAIENNLAYADFLRLHMRAAEFLEHDLPERRVATAWPLTGELTRPELGFVTLPVPVTVLPDFSAATLTRFDWNTVDVLVVYPRRWDPARTREELRGRIPLHKVAHFEQGGQWLDIYVR